MAGWGLCEASLIGLHVLRTLVLLSGTLQSLPLHKCQIFLLPTLTISCLACNNLRQQLADIFKNGRLDMLVKRSFP